MLPGGPSSHPGSATVVAGLTFGGKWPLESLVVVSALFYVGVCLVVREYAALKPFIMLLILSRPYIATILIGREIRELRLLVPLLLCLFFAYIQLASSRGQAFSHAKEVGKESHAVQLASLPYTGYTYEQIGCW
jgi:hypothetical protein